MLRNSQSALWDAIVDGESSDRVDYHGARLHAVVTEPVGDPAGRIERAIALAKKLGDAARKVGAAHRYPSRIRFGIDYGSCLAMSTGRSHEKDILFLGRPANHAAKLAAQSNEEGIFLTDTAQRHLAPSAFRKSMGQVALEEAYVRSATQRYQFDRLSKAADSLSDPRISTPVFQFHRATPPLAEVKFGDLTPSNSVRMGMASIFADIDGYTNFVDAATRGGSIEIRKAVETIHVIREELNSVLREDFGGKRVRFIGDCIQGCIAEGEQQDNPKAAIKEAAMCAAAMQSSFGLCLKIVKPGAAIDLAIGIEYGPTPLTRIGDAGDDSVRCAASRATVGAERVQQQIEGGGVRLGSAAVELADFSVRKHFGSGRLMSYDSAADLLGAVSSPVVHVVREQPAARMLALGDPRRRV